MNKMNKPAGAKVIDVHDSRGWVVARTLVVGDGVNAKVETEAGLARIEDYEVVSTDGGARTKSALVIEGAEYLLTKEENDLFLAAIWQLQDEVKAYKAYCLASSVELDDKIDAQQRAFDAAPSIAHQMSMLSLWDRQAKPVSSDHVCDGPTTHIYSDGSTLVDHFDDMGDFSHSAPSMKGGSI